MSIRRVLTLLPLTLFALACPTAQPDDDDVADDDDAAPYEQPAPWDDLDIDQRLEFMRELFEPRMRDAFQDFDAELYADFKCETCHGADMEAAEYAMPNGLFPLDNRGRPIEPTYNSERVRGFMDDEVVPLAEDLLDQDELGCFTCHERG